MRDSLPPPPSRRPDVEDDFADGPDPALWVAHYLPHWTTPDRSAARFDVAADGLRLRIDEDQLDWRPEDAPLRVSNLQTGVFSGPLGSTRGTHRHRPDGLTVRTETPARLLWAPRSGRVEVTVSASTDEGAMLAAWLVGTEHERAEDAGEICIFEIDADAVGSSTVARTGIKAHGDPGLRTDMAEVTLPFDAARPHTWTAIWGAGETVIGCEGVVVRRIPQAPDCPLFLLVDLFEVGGRGGSYPKTARLHRVRGWSGA
ncbi:hypothetical protein [Microbacterium sp. JZ37]|uniref:hypothetical protein n=1 Tax=Microbacterium sp. JZ37 TaxID=2654193 RepID=UPI002B48BF2B|nr:hypothetical protein [Microbacterium sp. JZ37]WRH19129.1 hypothetical protein GC092_15050 [Microbacterium sp. JZ37]